jgi:hypothetical protein
MYTYYKGGFGSAPLAAPGAIFSEALPNGVKKELRQRVFFF